MELNTLKTEYPKSYKLFHAKLFQTMIDLIGQSMKKHAEESGQEVPTIPEGLISIEEIDTFLDSALQTNPHGLFEVLDDNNIKIAIIPHTEDENAWLHYNNVDKESFRASSRKNAEIKAFENAVKILENQL